MQNLFIYLFKFCPKIEARDYLFYMLGVWFACVSVHLWVPDAQRGQKRVLNPLELEVHVCELPCGCLELSLGPLEEQPVCLSMTHFSGASFSGFLWQGIVAQTGLGLAV